MSGYEVGYGRPPVEHQIKKGERRNPHGRPKKDTGATDPCSILDAPVAVVKNGKRRTQSTSERILHERLDRALTKSDLRAVLYLIGVFEKLNLLAPSVRDEISNVVQLPRSMPDAMAADLLQHIGRPPWTDGEKAWARRRYLAQRSDEDRLFDEAMEFPDL